MSQLDTIERELDNHMQKTGVGIAMEQLEAQHPTLSARE
jgi:hypothetical protein